MSAPPPSLGLRHVRRCWLAIVGLANVAVLVAGLVGLPAQLMKRHEAVLDTRGRRTSAVVLGGTDRYRWFPTWPTSATRWKGGSTSRA